MQWSNLNISVNENLNVFYEYKVAQSARQAFMYYKSTLLVMFENGCTGPLIDIMHLTRLNVTEYLGWRTELCCHHGWPETSLPLSGTSETVKHSKNRQSHTYNSDSNTTVH